MNQSVYTGVLNSMLEEWCENNQESFRQQGEEALSESTTPR